MELLKIKLINLAGTHLILLSLSFDNVRVPKENLVGEQGRGFYYLMNGLQLERLCFLPSGVATMEFALSESLSYMSQRKAFGRTIDNFEVLRHRVSQLSSELEALKAFSYYCCDLFDRGIYDVKSCSIGKLLVTELTREDFYSMSTVFWWKWLHGGLSNG